MNKIIIRLGIIGAIAVIIFGCYFLQVVPARSYHDTARQIYEVLDRYRVSYDIDLCSIDSTASKMPQKAIGIDQFIQKVAFYVAHKKPITFLVLGFPFKSSNQEKKVIGSLPDMAERKALEAVQKIMTEISAIYKPGARVDIFCDGAVFADFFNISDETVIAYEQTLSILAKDLPSITIIGSQELMKRLHLTQEKSTILQQLRDMIEHELISNEETEVPIVALKRFGLELDYPQGRAILNHISLKDLCAAILKRQTKLRSVADKLFSSTGIFGEHIRLTVHFSKDISKKFGIQLIPGSCILPYHGVLVVQKDGTYSVQSKKDVDLNTYYLTKAIINGIDCYYFQERYMEYGNMLG